MTHRKRVAILTNIIAPYRIPVFQEIGRCFQTAIFHGGAETNREAWQNFESALVGLEIRKSSGIVIPSRRHMDGRFFEHRFTHVTPGYLPDLVSFRPDAVITNEMGVRTMTALAYGGIFGKPVWVWWGGTLHTERNLGRIKKTVRAILTRRVRRWISYGQTSTEYLSSVGIPAERILQIQNCVDERLFLEDRCPTLSLSPRPVILFVGRLVPLKGGIHLLDAASRLAAEGRKFTLLFVGGGPDKQMLESHAARLGIPNVVFHPHEPPSALPGIYRSADCLVFPTLEDVWGLVVNEAIWSRLPVISSIYAGCTREIVPRENRFDPLNADEFHGILERAIDGQIAPSDPHPLKTCRQVAAMIIRDIDVELTKKSDS